MTESKISGNVGEWYTRNNWLTERERGNLVVAYDNNTITINIGTASRVHAENDVIFTVPEPYRPPYNVMMIVREGSGYCNLVQILASTGEGRLWVNQTASGNVSLRGCITYLYNVV